MGIPRPYLFGWGSGAAGQGTKKGALYGEYFAESGGDHPHGPHKFPASGHLFLSLLPVAGAEMSTTKMRRAPTKSQRRSKAQRKSALTLQHLRRCSGQGHCCSSGAETRSGSAEPQHHHHIENTLDKRPQMQHNRSITTNHLRRCSGHGPCCSSGAETRSGSAEPQQRHKKSRQRFTT